MVRAKTAYNFFTSEKRKAVQEENPEMKFADITKKLGEMWKALSEEEKKPYQAMADEDKARVEKEKAENPVEPHRFITRRQARTSSSGSDSDDEDYR